MPLGQLLVVRLCCQHRALAPKAPDRAGGGLVADTLPKSKDETQWIVLAGSVTLQHNPKEHGYRSDEARTGAAHVGPPRYGYP
jgi:hypothetical protein